MCSNLTTKNPHLWMWFGPFGLGVWGSRPGPSCKGYGYEKRCCNVRPAYLYSGIAWMFMILDDFFQIPKKPVKMENLPETSLNWRLFFWSRNKSSPPVQRQTRLKFVWCVCRSTDRDAAHQVCLWFTRLDGDSLNDSNDGWFSNRKAPGDFVRYTKKVYNNVSTTPTAGWLTQSQNDPMNFLSSFLLRTFALHPKN